MIVEFYLHNYEDYQVTLTLTLTLTLALTLTLTLTQLLLSPDRRPPLRAPLPQRRRLPGL